MQCIKQRSPLALPRKRRRGDKARPPSTVRLSTFDAACKAAHLDWTLRQLFDMLATAALASASAAALRPLGASPSLRPPRAAALLRVQLAAARGAAGNQRRLPAVVVRASDKPGSEEGMAAVGSDLNWSHVARDVKRRLAAAVGGHESKQSQLQSWCGRRRPAGSGTPEPTVELTLQRSICSW